MIDRYHEAWRAYSEQGLETFIERCAPDVVVEEYAGVPGAAVWHGHEGLREMWSRWEQDFAGFRFEPLGEPEQIAERAFARRLKLMREFAASQQLKDWRAVIEYWSRDAHPLERVEADRKSVV